MPKALALRKPELFHIVDPDGTIYHGGSQEWYCRPFQRRAGCGPTNASFLLWCLSRQSPALSRLCPYQANSKDSFLRLMEDIWPYVTPKPFGIYSTRLFLDGALHYADCKGCPIKGDSLNLPPIYHARPDWNAVCRFFETSLSQGCPVAFLNRSNGSLRNLYNWHWVSVVSFDPETGMALMYDLGKESRIDLKAWLHTSLLGGGFAALRPAA